MLLWPLFFILSWTQLEKFELPPTGKVWGFLIGNALLGTALSEVLWVGAMWLTTPLTATVGLSLTIPLAMLGDSIIRGLSLSGLFIVGSMLVIVGFLGVNLCGLYEDWDRRVDAGALVLWRRLLDKLGFHQAQGYQSFPDEAASVHTNETAVPN